MSYNKNDVLIEQVSTMEYSVIKQSILVYAWVRAMRIASLDWVQPYLERMGFPSSLMTHREVLYAASDLVEKKERELVEASRGKRQSEELFLGISQEALNLGLQYIEQTIGTDMTEAFKRCTYLNIIDKSYHQSLSKWWLILNNACGLGNPGVVLLLPPESVQSVLPEVRSIIASQDYKGLDTEIYRDMPPFEYVEEMGLEMSWEAYDVLFSIHNEWVREALRVVVLSVPESQFPEIGAWAESVLVATGWPHKYLQGDTILRLVKEEMERSS